MFEDDWALTFKEEVIPGEQRFATVGMDFLGCILVVVYTYRGDDIRIISATPGGGNYQTLLNEALREYVGSKERDREKTVRKVIREELRALKKA